MKSIYYFLAVFMFLFPACTRNTNVEVPEPVKQSFAKMYPENHRNTWSITDENYYVAGSSRDEREIRTYFDAAGNWLKTETEFNSGELPVVIVRTIVSAYRGRGIRKSVKVEKPGMETYYALTLDSNGKPLVIYLSTSGVILPAAP